MHLFHCLTIVHHLDRIVYHVIIVLCSNIAASIGWGASTSLLEFLVFLLVNRGMVVHPLRGRKKFSFLHVQTIMKIQIGRMIFLNGNCMEHRSDGMESIQEQIERVPWTVEPLITTIMGCAPWASPWVAKAQEVVNMLDTVCLQPKVWNNLSIIVGVNCNWTVPLPTVVWGSPILLSDGWACFNTCLFFSLMFNNSSCTY